MEYQYLIAEERANGLAVQAASEWQATQQGQTDFLSSAVNIIKNRIIKNPKVYLEYGMYWPALKKVLNKYDANLGNELIDDPITKIYGTYAREDAVVVAAEDFRAFYKQTFLAGTNAFILDEKGTNWTLHDEDMEN